jgi:DNA repair exonuclease SbcCD ATPase subunit
MIVFKKMRIRNFLSYGNVATEIDFLAERKTLISGLNGSGKSVWLDAICFVLFNRAYKKINKSAMLNSFNSKNCLVEIELETRGKQFLIRRGMKPNVFEIFENGELIDQDAKNVDYQVYLEQTILGMNFKTFTQICVIGSANYKPFMHLSTQERREIVEDVLNIGVFGKMNKLLKEDLSNIRRDSGSADSTLTLAEDRKEVQEAYIKVLRADTSSKKEMLEKKKEEAGQNRKKMQSDLAELLEKRNLLVKPEDFSDEIEDLSVSIRTRQGAIRTLKGKLEKIESYLVCSECGTPTDEEHRKKHVTEYRQKIYEEQDLLDAEDKKCQELKKKQTAFSEYKNSYDTMSSDMKMLAFKIEEVKKKVKEISEEIEELSQTVDLTPELEKLEKLSKTAQEAEKTRDFLREEKKYLDIMQTLLKDDGIKSVIIKEYIPVINTLTNHYLGLMDFFVSFELDENFDEKILARHREDFKYESFSEGEKQRIDLALLLAWRKIASMNNASNCNLLIMDEVFDKSLDDTGVDHVTNILNDMAGEVNIFVVSHRGAVIEQSFDRHITVKKVNNYSELSYG